MVARTALLCPGQGSQKVGMGRDLADVFPEAREVFEQVDAALGFALTSVMWEGPEDLLTRTDNAQPAILAHTAAVWAVVRPRLVGTVAAAAGHSLGEYSAYLAAGSMDVAEAVRLVRRRGELMQQAGSERPGTMAAVLGLDTARVEQVCREASAAGGVVVAANLNEPMQTVISGEVEAVARASDLLKSAGAKRVVPLKVSGAFHSPLMAAAARGLEAALAEARIEAPAFPVVANATAEVVRTADDARRLLSAQLTSPVRWTECQNRLAELCGADARFVEIGPGAVLSGMAKRTVQSVATVSLGTAPEVAAFMEAA